MPDKKPSAAGMGEREKGGRIDIMSKPTWEHGQTNGRQIEWRTCGEDILRVREGDYLQSNSR